MKLDKQNLTTDMVGKTIASQHWGPIQYDHWMLVLVFTDGTFCAVRSTTGYEDSNLYILDEFDDTLAEALKDLV